MAGLFRSRTKRKTSWGGGGGGRGDGGGGWGGGRVLGEIRSRRRKGMTKNFEL